MMLCNTSIIYVITVFILLEGCSNNIYNNKYRSQQYISHAMNSNVRIYVSQDKKIDSFYKKKVLTTDVYKCNGINCCLYHKNIYTVKSGDTLFYIARITGRNYLDLAKINNIKDINVLKVGQVLQIHNNSAISHFKKIFVSFHKDSNVLKKILLFFKKNFFSFIYNNICFDTRIICQNNTTDDSKMSELAVCKSWIWPTNGKIVDTFSDADRGNKGIDISGVLGQPVLAAANGKVIYVGNTLKGYGNLIIIKHNNDYFSAYAHNDVILVTEQQNVKMGDRIANMGSSGINEIKLHFEIRYKGKSVDPLCYLPK